jgi:DNA-directed RNA polymerase subunit M/transcription elongation factor TFIIS
MQQCNKCNKILDISNFPITGKGYTSHLCKKCIAEYKKQWKITNPRIVQEQNKRWRTINRDKFLEKLQSIHDLHKNDPEYIKKRKNNNKLWYKNNKKRVADKVRELKHNNILFKIKCNLRTRLCHALKNNWKQGSAIRDLGCSIPELKTYLESKFQPGMTWDNWTTNGWHIDHIIPLSSFNLTDKKDFLKACHYTNLQPLWAYDNFKKGAKIE